MKLIEYLETVDFFMDLDDKYPDMPGISRPSLMDNLMRVEHGQKIMLDSIRSMPSDDVIDLVVAKYGVRWEALVRRELELANPNDRREVTETITKVEDKTSSNESINKVSAFNSATMVDNGGDTASGSDALTGETVKTIVDEKIDVRNAFNMLNVNVKTTIMTSVVSDVSSFLTLSIY